MRSGFPRARTKARLAETSGGGIEKPHESKEDFWDRIWENLKENPVVAPEEHPERMNYFYEVKKERAVFAERVLRVIRVTNHEKYGDQCSNGFFSPYFLKLDLSPKDSKAMLSGPFGEQKLTIKEAGDDSLIERRKGSLTIKIRQGKDGLKDWMFHPDKHDVEISYLKSCLKQIALEKKLVPEEYDSAREIAKLKERPDFEYGKDYSHLYSEEPLPMYEKDKSKAAGR